MGTATNPISHHTSHTLENGASSSNKGIHGNDGHPIYHHYASGASGSKNDIYGNSSHPIRHHTSHTLANGASSSNNGAHGDGENSNDNGGSSFLPWTTVSLTLSHSAIDQGSFLEASLTSTGVGCFKSIVNDTSPEPGDFNEDAARVTPSPCSSTGSSSHETDDSNDGIKTETTSMSSSINFANFSIIDSTLREGEQFATAYFDTAQKLKIAQALDDFGVEYIEVTSPAASEQSRADCEAICKLSLKAKILCHIRCNMDDARIAVQTGVDGINMCIGTSSYLMKHSHGKDMAYIAAKAQEIIEYAQSKNVEIRFSGEDSFRSNFSEILKLYSLVDQFGANRVGIADTVGGATPREVFEKIQTLRKVVSCDIETHFHNDTGCAIANAFEALEAGATHIDTTVLGIGERNGITPLGGLITCLILKGYKFILGKYKVEKLGYLERMIAEIVGVEIPFNNSVVCA